MPTDNVTTTLFLKQDQFKADPNRVRAILKEQYANVVKMQKELNDAAIAAKRTPPEFEVYTQCLSKCYFWSIAFCAGKVKKNSQ